MSNESDDCKVEGRVVCGCVMCGWWVVVMKLEDFPLGSAGMWQSAKLKWQDRGCLSFSSEVGRAHLKVAP